MQIHIGSQRQKGPRRRLVRTGAREQRVRCDAERPGRSTEARQGKAQKPMIRTWAWP